MRIILLLSIWCLFMTCQRPIDNTEVESEIRATEATFNQMAKEKGLQTAFLHFAAEESETISC